MELTLLQQNDSHGYIETHTEMFWYGSDMILRETGGLARVSHYVKKVKGENKNVLFIDGGDLFHGTGPAVLSKGDVLLPILNEMDIDAFVPGNWDYAYGPQILSRLCEALPFQALASNVYDKTTGKSFLRPYTVKELCGLKVGIIGLTYPYVDQTMPAFFFRWLIFHS